MSKDTIRVSETFISIQGEGRYAGRPALFWRLQGCVLNCKWCDTVEVWKRGESYSIADFLTLQASNLHKVAGWAEPYIVITGGDPLIQREEVDQLLLGVHDFLGTSRCIRFTIETEGVLKFSPLQSALCHFSVSPKLENSGMPYKRRIVLSVLAAHALHSESDFKFVTDGSEEAIEELSAIVKDAGITSDKIFLMPLVSAAKDYQAVSQKVVAQCIKYGLAYSPRLQVTTWDKTTGV